jgi:hypothetical protein
VKHWVEAWSVEPGLAAGDDASGSCSGEPVQ